MKKDRAAVITDSISPHFYFPLWHRYYGAAVGYPNLYVVTYAGSMEEFRHIPLGGLWSSNQYSNAERIITIAKIVSALLDRYDYVLRVDTDEFLVPDPLKFRSLAEYMGALQRPYVTAEGYDIVQGQEEEALRLDDPILIEQRGLAYPYDALNKTCVTSIPIQWAPGFHFCSVFPEFHHLYLMHLKRADLKVQLSIGAEVAARAEGEPNRDYHLTAKEKLISYNESVRRFPIEEGSSSFNRQDYRRDFRDNVKYTKNYGGVYHGRAFGMERVLVRLPAEFGGHF